MPTAVHACHGELHFGRHHLLAEVLQERSHLRRRRERAEAAGVSAAVDLKVPRRMFHRWRTGTEDNATSRRPPVSARPDQQTLHSPPRCTRRCSSCRRTQIATEIEIAGRCTAPRCCFHIQETFTFSIHHTTPHLLHDVLLANLVACPMTVLTTCLNFRPCL